MAIDHAATKEALERIREDGSDLERPLSMDFFVAVPDERSGEAVKAFVVRKDPDLTKEALIAYCRENLTAYKVPHLIEFREELPKTNVGKILRRALRDDQVSTS